jgi:hypothetical protein
MRSLVDTLGHQEHRILHGASGRYEYLETWESTMSDTVAHLVSAFVLVEALRTSFVGPSTASMSLVSDSVCTALAALDESCLVVWNASRPTEVAAARFERSPSWRDCLPSSLVRVEMSEPPSRGDSSPPPSEDRDRTVETERGLTSQSL